MKPSFLLWTVFATLASALYQPASFAQAGTAIYRLNCGGPNFTDWGGNLWVADTGYYNTGSILTTTSAVANTEADPLYQDVRYDGPDAPEMLYTLPVTKTGTYMVRFRFAEIDPAASAVGARVFDIALEGRVAFDDFDIVSQTGFLTAIVKEANVRVTDGALNIEFRHVTGNPLVNGIEVRYLGTGNPHTALTPSSLDFGSVTVGTTSASQTVTLKNDGSASVTVTSVQWGGTQAAAFSTNAILPFTLANGASKTVSFTFSPTVQGANSATLAFYSNATNSPNTVSLTGTGAAAPTALLASPASVDFSGQALGSTSPASKVTLTNTGGNTLQVTGLILGGANAGDFVVTAADLPISLAAGATTDVDLTFAPTAAGERAATLSVSSTGPSEDLVVNLSGTGLGPAFLQVSPSPLQFADTALGSSTGPVNLTLSNSGDVDLVVQSLTLSGDNASGFAIAPVTLPLTIGPQASTTVGVTFTPTVQGANSATLALDSNATNSPNTVDLTGTGTAAPAALLADPASVDFSGQALGTTSPASEVTLTNTGANTLEVTDLTLAGANAGDFAVTAADLPISLEAGGTTEIHLTFTPAAAGARAATLSVSLTGSSEDLVVNLTGTGLNPASLQVSPSPLQFADTALGSSSDPVNLTLTNGGDVDLTIQSLTLSGDNASDFTLAPVTLPLTISPQGSTTVGVTFTPGAEGIRTASLSIASNDPASPNTVSLTGTGAAAPTALLADPASVDFNGQALGTTSPASEVTLTNTGANTLEVTALTLAGANAGDFAVTAADLPISLEAGGTTEIHLTFTPAAAGARAATLSVSSTGPSEDLVVNLTGTGLNPASLQVSPSSLQFSDTALGSSSAPVNLTLTNGGDVDLTIQSLTLSGDNASDFTLAPVTLPLTISPQGSTTVGATFTPGAQGIRAASLSITSDDAASPASVPFSGKGVAAGSAAVYRLNCGGPNYTDPSGNLWTADTGYFNTGSSYTVTSAIALTDMDPLYQAQRFDHPTAPEMTYSLPLSAGTYKVRLHFAETYSGAASVGARYFDVKREGQLILNDLDVFKEVGLNAALVKEFTTTVTDGTLNLDFIHQKQNPLIDGIEVLGQSLIASPTSLSLPAQALGTTSPASKVTLTNNGTTGLQVTALTLGGANAGDFAVSSAALPLTLAPGATSDVDITFTPTAAGARAASLTVSSTDPVGNIVVSLSGTGLNPAKLQPSPASVQFPNTTLGSSSIPLALTLTNAGDVDLIVQSLTLSGSNASDFTLAPVSLPLTIAAHASTTVSLTFTPSASGARTASLSIDSNDPASPAAVPLAGQGTAVPTGVVYRLNCGGPNYTDPSGNLWTADTGYFNIGSSFAVTSAISLTDLDPLYQAQRFDHPTAPEMTYSLPLSAGSYKLRLHFAETYSGAASVGARYFDIKCEGQLILNDLDVFKEVGLNAALVKEFLVNVTDGTMNLDFIHQKQNPMIDGIEVMRQGVLTAQPTALQWGHVNIGTTQTESLTLTNESTFPLTVTSLGILVNLGTGADFTATFGGNAYVGDAANVTYSTAVTIEPGESVPVSVDFAPAQTIDDDVSLLFTGDFDPVQVQLVGSGATGAGDPFLHVDIEAPAYVVDYDGDGSENVTLIGSGSHTHELGETITGFEWKENGVVIDTTADTVLSFPVGTHTVSLTITDSNSPPRTLTDSATFVVATSSNVPGALVSYFDGGENGGATVLLDAVPANADFAEVRPSVQVVNEFGYVGGSSFTSNVMVRVLAKVSIAEAGSYDFAASGGSARRLFLGGVAVTDPVALDPGVYGLEARFAVDDVTQLPLDVTVAKDSGAPVSVDPAATTHDETQLLPVINTAPTGGSSFGGDPVELTGIGFFPADQVVVHWGATTLTGQQLTVSPNSIRLTSPSGQGTIAVTVQTPQGTSNAVGYTYSTGGSVPVQFALSDVVNVTAPTQAVWGNDGRLYVGSITGAVYAFTFDDNYGVTDVQTITTLEGLANNNILGIGVNPFDPPGVNRIYVGHGLLFANGGACFSGVSPYSGQVTVLTGPDFSTATPLITGLPVSNHDHGINGIEFDSYGNMLFCVGGNTNAGVQHCNMGNLPESPLTAAILKAPVWKSSFNGAITYVETATGLTNNDQVYGGVVDVAPGISVSVYASGFRNPYDLVMTTMGRLYNSDNGPNNSFGPASLTATTSTADPTAPDELDLAQEGHYYGHPNRNRGRYDNRQNTYRHTSDAPVGGNFTQCLTTFASSTNGIAEYRAQTFQGAMRGNIVAQKWKGQTYRVVLAPDGRSVVSNAPLNVNFNSLDVVPGPGGVILGIDYTNNKIVIARPVDPTAIGLKLFDIFPWRAPVQGGSPFTIGGLGFGTLANTQVTIGGVAAQLTSVGSTRIRGIVPPNAAAAKELHDVAVTVNGTSVSLPKAFQYLLSNTENTGSKAWFSINPGGTLIGSTSYSSGTFKISNNSSAGQKISRVEIDLSTALFPDDIFDPYGQGGDPVGKDFTPDSDPGVGIVSNAFTSPHDGGFDKLDIVFNDFDPGETFTFSADVDPSSIKGAPGPGPGESGSVAGIELIGARITVYFSDGTVRGGEPYRIPGSQCGSETYVEYNVPEAPGLEINNQTQPQLTTSDASQVMRVSGPSGSAYQLVRVEGALYTAGAVGGGFDIDPYEANTAIALQEYSGAIGPGGFTDVPVTLTKSVAEGGFNYFRAAFKNGQGRTGPVSQTVVIQYAP